jgi:hypothetical protein
MSYRMASTVMLVLVLGVGMGILFLAVGLYSPVSAVYLARLNLTRLLDLEPSTREKTQNNNSDNNNHNNNND